MIAVRAVTNIASAAYAPAHWCGMTRAPARGGYTTLDPRVLYVSTTTLHPNSGYTTL